VNEDQLRWRSLRRLMRLKKQVAEVETASLNAAKRRLELAREDLHKCEESHWQMADLVTTATVKEERKLAARIARQDLELRAAVQRANVASQRSKVTDERAKDVATAGERQREERGIEDAWGIAILRRKMVES
jgi:hypothetical protein